MNQIEAMTPTQKRQLLRRLLQSRLDQQAPSPVVESTPVSFDQFAIPIAQMKPEAILDSSLRFDAPRRPPPATPRQENVFLTGATGFLGSFLLHDLLEDTQSTIYCLVRAATVEGAMRRIRKSLDYYFPGNTCDRSRIKPIPGDLSKPLFGLEALEFERLAATVDTVYHNGAIINWLFTYRDLKATNVSGTQEVIRLASLVDCKPLHYVSTVAAFPLEESFGVNVFEEQDLGDASGRLYGGYPQSKWVAEQLVTAARSRGLPVCIYRPGVLTGHSSTGTWRTSDMWCWLLKTFVESGVAPDFDAAIDMTPANYVSRAIVHLSKSSRALGQIYHLSNPHPVRMQDLVSWMRMLGYRVKRIPYETWREQFLALARAAGRSAISSFAPLFSTVADGTPTWMADTWEGSYQGTVDRIVSVLALRYGGQSIQLDCTNALRDLAGSSIICPPIDDTLLSTYFSYFARVGFVNAPS